ncbi:hypothetical protein [Bradyrhizobium sp. ARR65]|uniref:hypothetical protein n=1 Tax=Bradyrhizobium sp. ARR65 TaxID=1040989 RepID=UPI0012FC82C5|nr:hypothetical protein [Bradyrhizobium sp. ARR65]
MLVVRHRHPGKRIRKRCANQNAPQGSALLRPEHGQIATLRVHVPDLERLVIVQVGLQASVWPIVGRSGASWSSLCEFLLLKSFARASGEGAAARIANSKI